MAPAMIRLDKDERAPAAARALVGRFGAGSTVVGAYDIGLVVSELVTGAVRAASVNDHVRLSVLRTPTMLRIEVEPFHPGTPDTALTDRERTIVEAIADSWGILGAAPDLTVWAEFGIGGAPQTTRRT